MSRSARQDVGEGGHPARTRRSRPVWIALPPRGTRTPRHARAQARPLSSASDIEAVTGPKIDDWLVHMVGLRTLRMLAILAVASYLVNDMVCAAVGVISPIYLLDAVAEIALVAGHIVWRPREADAIRA